MTNFKDSFNSGLAIAIQANNNKAEVQGVFDELNKQLAEETGGKLSISIKSKTEGVGLMRMMAALTEPKKYLAIIAENPKAGSQDVELAKWDQQVSGYPCRVTIQDSTVYCEDKKSLENALSDLLKNPFVAQELYRLIHLPEMKKI